MNAWKADQEAENIIVIPDGNGDFTAGMGMLVGKEDIGFGKRSWRYSMLVESSVIEKMFVEPNEPGDPFKFLMQILCLNLKPNWTQNYSVSIFTKQIYLYCAKKLY